MNKIGSWIAVAVLIGAIGAALYAYLPDFLRPPAPLPVVTPAPTASEPVVRYPIERVKPESPVAEDQPLPSLPESDDSAKSAAAEIVGKDRLAKWFYPDSVVRRMVVTVDNLPNKQLPERYRLSKPVAGKLAVTEEGGATFLHPGNDKRYTPYVQLFQQIDTKKLVALYVRFYPLLQEEYRNLGRPSGHFNDRLVETIDDLLAAPVVDGPVQLVRPNVFYQYADPRLEGRSAGQKLMIRLGPSNAAAVKEKLKEIRAALAPGEPVPTGGGAK